MTALRQTPRVSVVIPAYEAGSLLTDALGSVQQQSGLKLGSELEAVVADDGAVRPDSLEALRRASHLPWVKLLKTAGSTGPSNARNLAAAAAEGEWLAFLDADDLYEPCALRTRLDAAQRNPGADCVATDYAEFPAHLRWPTEPVLPVIEHFPQRRVAVEEAYAQRREIRLQRPALAFVGAVPLWTGAVLVKRSLYTELGGFPTAHAIGEDLHLWLRIAASTDVVYLPEVTAYCRKGHASLTKRAKRQNLQLARCFEDLQAQPLMADARPALRGQIAQAYAAESYAARHDHRLADALRMGLQSLRWAPASARSWRTLLSAPFPARGSES